MNKAFVHELGRGIPKTTADLIEIATKSADGEDAVGAIFHKRKSPHDADVPNNENGEGQEHSDKRWRNHQARHDDE
jgi:hypothetical protein